MNKSECITYMTRYTKIEIKWYEKTSKDALEITFVFSIVPIADGTPYH